RLALLVALARFALSRARARRCRACRAGAVRGGSPATRCAAMAFGSGAGTPAREHRLRAFASANDELRGDARARGRALRESAACGRSALRIRFALADGGSGGGSEDPPRARDPAFPERTRHRTAELPAAVAARGPGGAAIRGPHGAMSAEIGAVVAAP